MRGMKQNTSPLGLAFLKMHGLGNDFVVIDSRGRGAVTTPALAKALGDRHRGVGFDQLAELRDAEDADLTLDFWNSDGSRAGACGNATRCVAWLVMRETGAQALTIRTTRGLLFARMEAGQVWVNMGAPLTDWQGVPLKAEMDTQHLPLPGDPVGVGMGNPHCVFLVEDAEAVALEGKEGEKFEAVVTDTDQRGARIQICAPPVVARIKVDGLIAGQELNVRFDGADPSTHAVHFSIAS